MRILIFSSIDGDQSCVLCDCGIILNSKPGHCYCVTFHVETVVSCATTWLHNLISKFSLLCRVYCACRCSALQPLVWSFPNHSIYDFPTLECEGWVSGQDWCCPRPNWRAWDWGFRHQPLCDDSTGITWKQVTFYPIGHRGAQRS